MNFIKNKDKMTLSWCYDVNCDGPIFKKVNCSLGYILFYLYVVSQRNGVFYLRKEAFNNPEYPAFRGAGALEIDMIDGDYFMWLFHATDTGTEMRNFRNSNRLDEIVEFNESEWSGAFLCNDMSIMKEVCRQFFETGDVSYDILDFSY